NSVSKCHLEYTWRNIFTTLSFRNNYDGLIYRVNMLMALVNSLYAPFNINIVVVQLEIWEHDRSQLNVEEHHLLATLAQFKRMHTTVRHDCLHALL
ncbi:Subfamily M12B unassigned peptidase (M12 family), partial [Fasciola gigantica]